MKKVSILLAITMLINLFSVLASADGTDTIPTDFIAGWDFEELTDSGAVADLNESTTKYDGVIKGNASRTVTAKYLGTYGLNCTGSNGDWMTAPGLGNAFAEKSAISISGWYKVSSMDKERQMFSIQNGKNASGMSMNVQTTGKIKVQLRTANESSGNLVSATSSAAVTTDVWTHITAVVSLPEVSGDKGLIQVYINGTLSGSAEVDVNGMTSFEHFEGASTDTDFKVGGLGSASFIGSLDEFKVYDRVLSASEISLIAAQVPEETDQAETPGDFMAGWDFEELTESGTVTDLNESTTKYNGVIKGNVSRTASAKYLGTYGLNCTGSNGDWMAAPGLGNALAEKSAISISGWYKVSSMDKERSLFSVQNGLNASGMSMNVLTTGKVKVQLRTANVTGGNLVSATSSTAVTTDVWTHITAVITLPEVSGDKGLIQVYINGALSGSAEVDVNGMTSFEHFEGASTDTDFKIGGLGSASFIGSLDEFKVYARALTADEVTALASVSQDTEEEVPVEEKKIAGYDFENSENNIITDTTGNEKDGVLNTDSGIELGVGYRGYGAVITGSQDTYMTVDDISTALNGAKAITVAGWYRYDTTAVSLGKSMKLFQIQQKGTTDNAGLSAYFDKSDNKLKIDARSTGTDSWSAKETGIVASDEECGVWHHYIVIVDFENKTSQLIYDGEKQEAQTYTNLTLNKFTITDEPSNPQGMFGCAGTQPFVGAMDEIGVWNYALSDDEIKAITDDTRTATEITKLSFGGYDCLEALVSDTETEFGMNLDTEEAVSGIESNVNSIKVYKNGIEVDTDTVFNTGDTAVIVLQGDLWESPQYYKINIGVKDIETTALIAKCEDERIYELCDGSIECSVNVRNNSENAVKVYMLTAMYDVSTGMLVGMNVCDKELASGESQEMSTVTDVVNAGKYEVKSFVWDGEFKPVKETLELSRDMLEIASVIGDNAVIQRDTELEIWGKACPQTEVCVSFGDDSVSAVADENGDFSVVLEAQPANAEPQTLTITNLVYEREYSNILVGDVWFCGGQSNMRWTLNTCYDDNKALAADNALIRFYDQDNSASSEPQFDTVNGAWSECTEQSALKFSAVGYMFADQLIKMRSQEDADVPIGLVNASYGGSRIEAWMSANALTDFQDLESNLSSTDVRRPSWLYNSMFHPLENYKYKGMIFYQGEANTYNAELYAELFDAYAEDMRENVGFNMPIIYAQLALYDGKDSEDYIGVRDVQLNANIPNSAMVVIADITDDVTQIHPQNKLPVSLRMARAALGLVYGSDIEYISPTVESAEFSRNKVTLTFKNAGAQGLKNQTLCDFKVVSDGVEYSADASVSGENTVTVECSEVSEISEVRYLQSEYSESAVSLYGVTADGYELPASPFKVANPEL